jgi:hypothetical protein
MILNIRKGARFLYSDLSDVLTHLNAIKLKQQQIAAKLWQRYIMVHATNIADDIHYLGRKYEERASPISIAYKNVQERLDNIRLNNHADPEIDLSFKIVLYGAPGHIVCSGTTYQDDMWNAFLAEPFIEDFQFFDQGEPTRRDLVITEWRKRRKIWHAAVPNHNYSGLEYELHPVHAAYVPPDITYAPTLQTRAARVAKEIITARHYDRFIENEDRTHQSFKGIIKMIDWLETPEALQERAVEEVAVMLSMNEVTEDYINGQ